MEMASYLHLILRLAPEGVTPQQPAFAEELQRIVDCRQAHMVTVGIQRRVKAFCIEMPFHYQHPGEYGKALRSLPETVLLEVARKLFFGLSPRLFVSHLACRGGSAKVLKTLLNTKHFAPSLLRIRTRIINICVRSKTMREQWVLVLQRNNQINMTMKKYRCLVCDWIYDPATGDPEGGIAPGTAFEDIPNDWVCPVCGVGKDDFEPEPDE